MNYKIELWSDNGHSKGREDTTRNAQALYVTQTQTLGEDT